jgi:hypothetical protein
MSPFRLCLPLLVAGLAVAQDPKDKKPVDDVFTRPQVDRRDQTLLKRVSEKTYVHEAAQVAFTVPEGWKEIYPHRLERKIDPRITTVLGIERPDGELVASLYWMQMGGGQALSYWVRETADRGEYGEEYETLKTVYGKDHVSAPVRSRSGPFDVYRINITGGQDRRDKYDGVLFLFAVESGGANWLVRVRITLPKGDKARNDAWAQEVLGGFTKVPGPPPVKVTNTEGALSDKR